jgi:mannonate dehydratase
MADKVKAAVARGYKHVRLNYIGKKPAVSPGFAGMPTEVVIDPEEWVREIPRVFEHVRKTCGEEIELMQHLHGQLPPQATIGMVKRLEPFRPYFFEDPFYPEDIGYLKNLRQVTTVPIAIGEKFVNEQEYVALVTDRLMDFIRVHVPAIGGFTKSWKLTVLGEWFAVRTAWHAPADLSPVGHAANGHLDLAALNFGIQEGSVIHGDAIREVFPGTPVVKNGFLYVNEAPGFGIDINEKAAAKFPCKLEGGNWGPKRSPNGSIIGN